MKQQPHHWKSHASGSLMLFGEHAVLHDCPAIACAIDNWLTIDWQTRQDSLIFIHTSLGEHATDWDTLTPHPKLTFVLEALAQFKAMTKQPLTGLTLNISSDIDSTQGLGSSSAVVAAMVTGFSILDHSLKSIQIRFNLGLNIIRGVQGRGSGTDLAAALTGGVIMLTPKENTITQLANGLPIVSIYSGYKTPTPIVIARVKADWSDTHPLFLHWLAWTTQITTLAAMHIRHQNLIEIGRCMNMAHGLMNGLGVSDPQLEVIAIRLRQTEGMYGAKISGSGLGDCVIGLGVPVTKINDALSLQTTAQKAYCTTE